MPQPQAIYLPLSVFESFLTPRSFFLISYPDTNTTTLSSCSSLLIPCDASTPVLELLDEHLSFARLVSSLLPSRTGREMFIFSEV
jgi:hypothetical protein